MSPYANPLAALHTGSPARAMSGMKLRSAGEWLQPALRPIAAVGLVGLLLLVATRGLLPGRAQPPLHSAHITAAVSSVCEACPPCGETVGLGGRPAAAPCAAARPAATVAPPARASPPVAPPASSCNATCAPPPGSTRAKSSRSSGKRQRGGSSKRTDARIAYVTSVLGGYEHTAKPVAKQTVPSDFIVYTDNMKIATQGVWKPVDARKYAKGLDKSDVRRDLPNSVSALCGARGGGV